MTPRQSSHNRPRAENVQAAFDELWRSLFSTRVHLDSALSKQPSHLKSILAPIVRAILLRPAALAEATGIGVPEGEPWFLKPEQLAEWRPARLLAQRLYEGMSQGLPEVVASEADFPPQMIAEWRSDSPDELAELVQELSSEPPLSLRASKDPGAAAVLRELKPSLPVRSTISDIAPMGIRLEGYVPVLSTPVYERGLFEIQDEGSQFMSLFSLWPELFGMLLQTRPGKVQSGQRAPAIPETTPAWTVVDACAGAGGKTLAIADALGGKGRVFSYDVSAVKLQALRRRASRSPNLRNVQAVQVEENAESKVVSQFRRRANAVLVDAPCSGWGVLRRNPDAKWRQSQESLDRMPAIQLRLLSEYSDLVAPGGLLTFGVCTFRKAETTGVVDSFLSKHPDFERGPGGYLGPGPSDGFFMQSFKRRPGA